MKLARRQDGGHVCRAAIEALWGLADGRSANLLARIVVNEGYDEVTRDRAAEFGLRSGLAAHARVGIRLARGEAMHDVTYLFSHYRLTARALWNFGFRAQTHLEGWDARERFDEIKKKLFAALVTEHVAMEGSAGGKAVFQVRVVPSGGVPIMIKTEAGRDEGIWDYRNRVLPGECILEFVDYFDWDFLGVADFQYVHVKIAAWANRPDVVGHHALIETSCVRMFTEAAA